MRLRLLLVAVGLAGLAGPAAALDAPGKAAPAPAFTHVAAAEWLNGPPQTLAALRGQVVLLDVWTFACYNCYRSFPWLNTLERRYAPQGLRVIGVHTPEFDHERVRANIAAKLAEYGLRHPVMIDNDFSYWNALGNRYWPAWYLLDRQGRVRARYAGETHAGDTQALRKEGSPQRLEHVFLREAGRWSLVEVRDRPR